MLLGSRASGLVNVDLRKPAGTPRVLIGIAMDTTHLRQRRYVMWLFGESPRNAQPGSF